MMNSRIRHVLLAGLFLLLGTEGLAAPPDKPKPLVFTQKIQSEELYDLLTYPARLVPIINATLLAETDGVIDKVFAPLGTIVSRNQNIMRLIHTDPVYQYAPAYVKAPVGGVVSSVEVTEGSRVKQGASLAAIVNPSRIKITIEVAVSDLSAIKRGLRGELRVSGEKDPFPVKVVGLSPFADPATGTATAELSLVQSKHSTPRLPPGMLGTVSFKARNHAGFEVPESAVVYRGQDPYLRLVENNKIKFAAVTLGETRSGNVEILKGLVPDMLVVIRSSTFVGNGEEVTIQALDGSQDTSGSKGARP